MSEYFVLNHTTRSGTWTLLLGSDNLDAPSPDIRIDCADQRLSTPQVTSGDRAGTWRVSVELPASLLSEGYRTILVVDQTTEETLTHLSIWTGQGSDENVTAEIDLLRAELDMLKRAFRKHCVDTLDIEP